MACLMDSDGALLGVGHDLCLFLKTSNDSVYGVEEVLLTHCLAVVASGNERCLVTYIGYVGTGKAWCLTRQEVDVEALVGLNWFKMHLEYRLTLVKVGQVDMYLPVETSSSHEGRIEHIGSVGGCKYNYATVGAETVHFGE